MERQNAMKNERQYIAFIFKKKGDVLHDIRYETDLWTQLLWPVVMAEEMSH